MALDTYANLLIAAAGWLHRTDLTNNLPDFVDLCEADMQRQLNTAEMETTATLSLTLGSSTVALPVGFDGARRLRRYDGFVYEDMQLVGLTPTLNNGAGGTPQIASIQGNNLIIRPPPAPGATTYSIVLDYYAKFPPLSDANPSNWILANHPDAYLYGMLAHSAPFLGTDARVQVWLAAYNNAIDGINTDDARKRFNGIQMRTDYPNRRPSSYSIYSDNY